MDCRTPHRETARHSGARFQSGRLQSAVSKLFLGISLLAFLGGEALAQGDDAPVLDATTIEDRPGFLKAVSQIAQGEEAAGVAVSESPARIGEVMEQSLREAGLLSAAAGA